MMGRPPRGIPWLDKRDNGIWYVLWYDGEARQTRRQSLKTAELKPATTAYADFLLSWSEEGRPSRRSLKVVLDFYLKRHIGRSANDTERPMHAAKPILRFFRDRDLRTIDVPACHDYMDARRKQRISDGTIRRELYVIQAAANYALKHKQISTADMPTIDAPRDSPARRAYLTHQELEKIFSTAEADLQDFIALAYYTGSRRGAIEDLTVRQVDLAGGLIELMPHDASPTERLSKKKKPTVPIMPEIRNRLERLVERKMPAATVLPPRSYYHLFKAHATKQGLMEKSYPHILRHSRATHLLQAGVPIYAVAKLLGDTMETIEASYGHHSSDYLSDVFRGKGPKLD